MVYDCVFCGTALKKIGSLHALCTNVNCGAEYCNVYLEDMGKEI